MFSPRLSSAYQLQWQLPSPQPPRPGERELSWATCWEREGLCNRTKRDEIRVSSPGNGGSFYESPSAAWWYSISRVARVFYFAVSLSLFWLNGDFVCYCWYNCFLLIRGCISYLEIRRAFAEFTLVGWVWRSVYLVGKVDQLLMRKKYEKYKTQK